MKMPLQIVSLMAALVLVGAGCQPATAPTPDDAMEGDAMMSEDKMEGDAMEREGDVMEKEDKMEGDAMMMEKEDAMKGDAMEKSEGAMMEVDDTWEIYDNDALGFSFQWPTKGRYAPHWQVTFEKEDSEKIADGCFVAESSTKGSAQGGGHDFCRTTVREEASSTDRYVTKVGSTYVILTFTKTVPESLMNTHSWDDYTAHLDQIVGTFEKK